MRRLRSRRPSSRLGRGNRLLVAVALGLVATSVGAAQPAAAAGLVARWPMNEQSGTVMSDEVSPTFENGTIGPLVGLMGDSFEFPGWKSNVSTSGRLQGSVPAGGSLVEVPDPNRVFDPAPGLLVATELKTRLTLQGHLPTKAANGSPPSYNIVQKGRSDSPGGFWKLELAGSGANIGRIRCAIRDGTRSKVATSTRRVDDGAWHAVACELAGGKLTAVVDGARSSVSASALGAVHPGGRWGTSVWIGKKPGSTDPADAFAGWLRQAQISIL